MYEEFKALAQHISLPNAVTWTCMVLVLIVMLFVRFAKPWQLRHWDLLLLLLLTVPILFLRDSQERRDDQQKFWSSDAQLTMFYAEGLARVATGPMQVNENTLLLTLGSDLAARSDKKWQRQYGFQQQAIWQSYMWLLIVSGLLLIRCLLDLGLEQRSELRCNVTTGGMIWLCVVMLLVMGIKSILPDWRGVPVPKNENLVMLFLTQMMNSGDVVNVLTLICHAILVLHLILIGWLHFKNLTIGVAAALLYLLMPYTAIFMLHLSQVAASMFIVLAITWYRSPVLAGLFLGLGTGFGFFPAILVPAWTGFYFRRGHGRFLMTYLLVILLFVGFLASIAGLGQAWDTAWMLAEWQAWKFAIKPTADGLWNSISLHAAYRIPLFIAFIALMITSAFWPHPKHLGQLISWSATLILGVQFWYADAGGTYVLWYLPLVILQTVRPALYDVRAARIIPSQDRLARIWRWLSPWRQTALKTSPQDRETPTQLAG